MSADFRRPRAPAVTARRGEAWPSRNPHPCLRDTPTRGGGGEGPAGGARRAVPLGTSVRPSSGAALARPGRARRHHIDRATGFRTTARAHPSGPQGTDGRARGEDRGRREPKRRASSLATRPSLLSLSRGRREQAAAPRSAENSTAPLSSRHGASPGQRRRSWGSGAGKTGARPRGPANPKRQHETRARHTPRTPPLLVRRRGGVGRSSRGRGTRG